MTQLAQHQLATGTWLELARNVVSESGARMVAGTLCRVLATFKALHQGEGCVDTRVLLDADGTNLSLWVRDHQLRALPADRQSDLREDQPLFWHHASPEPMVEVWEGFCLSDLRAVRVTFRPSPHGYTWRAEVCVAGMCIAVHETRVTDRRTASRLARLALGSSA